ncbi:hypothetical protein [Corynebacterium aquilae]|uniref:hypothetical protein n=1 Tax=Corynebacterium aquilae TaxID=203263 RepID=UPI0012EE5A9D|nr:hypothetical protein [Corynebacterium aquilae]
MSLFSFPSLVTASTERLAALLPSAQIGAQAAPRPFDGSRDREVVDGCSRDWI